MFFAHFYNLITNHFNEFYFRFFFKYILLRVAIKTNPFLKLKFVTGTI